MLEACHQTRNVNCLLCWGGFCAQGISSEKIQDGVVQSVNPSTKALPLEDPVARRGREGVEGHRGLPELLTRFQERLASRKLAVFTLFYLVPFRKPACPQCVLP